MKKYDCFYWNAITRVFCSATCSYPLGSFGSCTYNNTYISIVILNADDFIVTARDNESLYSVRNLIQDWMSERGLELSSEKTVITSLEDGFDFLGFNSRHYKGKLLIKLSKKKVLAFCKQIGEDVSNLKGAEQEVLIKRLNPILRGSANYYKGVVSKETFSYISSRVWRYLWRWAKRRHPNKNTKWV